MKHNIRIALALCLLLLALPSCSKEKKPEVEDKSAVTEDKSAEPGESAKEKATGKVQKISLATGAVSPELGPILRHMPADTEILVSMNLASLTGTPLWQKLGPAAMAQAGGGLDKAKETCGFDPITTLTSIHLGVNSARDSEPVVLVKGLRRKPLIACIKSMAAIEKAVVEVTDEGNFTTVKGKKDDETQGIVWLDESTLLLVPGKVNKPYLQARLDGKDGLNGNADFAANAAKANQLAPIWFAGKFDSSSKAAKGMAAMGSQPKAVYGSVGFDEGIQFSLGLTFADEAAARATLGQVTGLMGMAKGSMGPLATLVDKVQMATAGPDLQVSLNMNKAEVDQLSNMASMFSPK